MATVAVVPFKFSCYESRQIYLVQNLPLQKTSSLTRNELSAIKGATLSTLPGLTQCPVTFATTQVIKFCELTGVQTSVVPVVSLVRV